MLVWEQGKSGSWWGAFSNSIVFLGWSNTCQKYAHPPTRAGGEHIWSSRVCVWAVVCTHTVRGKM